MSRDPTSPVSPLAAFPPAPSPEARSRAPEFYGFAVLTSTYILFFTYLLWALLPDAYITALGVSWYPSREWAVLLPAYSIVLVLLTYFTYFALAFAGTPRFSDPATITDSKAHYRNRDTAPPNAYFRANPELAADMHDIPIGIANRALYGPRQQSRQDSIEAESEQHASPALK